MQRRLLAIDAGKALQPTKKVAVVDRFRELGPWDIVGSCVVFSSLALAQPLLGLLGQNPEFFLAQRSSPFEIVAIGLLVGVAIPFVVGAAVWGVHRVAFYTGTAVHLTLLLVLALILWVQILEYLGVRALPLLGVGGLLLGGGSAALYVLSGATRWGVRLLAVLAPIAIVLNFILVSPVAALVFTSAEGEERAPLDVENPVPIVMIVLDELPLASLIDGTGLIQEDLYPNFARLAEDSMWYRNAATVESNTVRAIPTLLTGTRADKDALPVTAHYPDNLFTLLGDVYNVSAIEPLTSLCPERTCRDDEPRISSNRRWRQMLSDLRIVTLHLVLPEGLSADLPPIDQNWADFATEEVSVDEPSDFDLRERVDEHMEGDRVAGLQQLLDRLEASSSTAKPSFAFLHLMLPHQPWIYLPDGRLHGAPLPVAAGNGSGWVDDEWLVNQIYQQHLLQVQFTDRLIGRVLDRMRELGTYDESLIVVLADHGVTFRPGVERRRGLTEESVGEIAAIPLFIKFPGGVVTGVDDYRAEVTDVAPTIADLLAVELEWATTGHSLISDSRPIRTNSSVDSGAVMFGASGEEKLEVAARRLEVFDGGDPFSLTVEGFGDLLNARVEDLEIEGRTSFWARIAAVDRYESLELSARTLPAYLSGTLSDASGDGSVLGVAVNGSLAAITQTFLRDGITTFQVMLPPDRLSESNEIGIFLLEGSGADRRVRVVPLDG